jgi:hypothetical protein
MANSDGETYFSSVVSNKSEDNYIAHMPFNPVECSFIQKLHRLYGEGFKQLSPYFINIIISTDGKIIYLSEDGDIIHDSILIDIDKDKSNNTLHKYKINHGDKKDNDKKKSKKSNAEHEYQLDIND